MAATVASIAPEQQWDPKDPENPEFALVREAIQTLIDAGDITARQLSNEAGANETALNQFLNKKHGTNTRMDRVHDRLHTWLETYQRRVAAQAEFPTGPGFRLTPTAERLTDALMYAHHAQDIVGIYGGAGYGKTETAKEYVRNNSGVCLSTMSNVTKSVMPALREIAKCLDVRQYRTQATLFDGICDALHQSKGLLIVDEANHLTGASVDQLRQIHDRAAVGIVLMGNTEVYAGMTRLKTADFMAQAASRVGMWVNLDRRTPADKARLRSDADQLLDAWKVTAPDCRKILHEVAAKPGALRLMDKVLRFASMLSGGQPLEAKHLRAARSAMGSHVAGGAQ